MNNILKKKNILLCLLMIIGSLFIFSGCTKEETVEGSFRIYYLNSSADGLTSTGVELKADNFDDRIHEVLDDLKTASEDNSYQTFLGDDLKISKYSYSDGYFDLYFEGNYEKLSSIKQHLIRYALVKTFIQLEEVDVVGFYNHDQQLIKADGTPFGYLSDEDFIEVNNERLPRSEMTVMLYYADSEGKSLSLEEHKIQLQMYETIEAAVIKELMKEPQREGNIRVIPENTTLLDVTLSDGTCYVNFDRTFTEQDNSVEPIVVINAIATTLTQFEGIERVQIQIEGSSETQFRDSVDLRKTYTGN